MEPEPSQGGGRIESLHHALAAAQQRYSVRNLPLSMALVLRNLGWCFILVACFWAHVACLTTVEIVPFSRAHPNQLSLASVNGTHVLTSSVDAYITFDTHSTINSNDVALKVRSLKASSLTLLRRTLLTSNSPPLAIVPEESGALRYLPSGSYYECGANGPEA